MKLETLKRVKVLLTAKTHQQLQALAGKKGLPIAKLILNWLRETDRQNLLVGRASGLRRSVIVEARLHPGEFQYLEKLANSLGISLSLTFARVIEFNLSRNPFITSAAEQIANTWWSGMFQHFSPEILNRVELLDHHSMYTVIRTYIEAGDFKNAKDLIYLLENSLTNDPLSERYRALLLISKSRLARSEKDLFQTQATALEALAIGQQLLDDHVIGLANFRLGIFELGKGDTTGSMLYFERAAAHLAIRQDPFIFLQIYLMKGLIAATQFDTRQYEIYMGLSAEILRAYPNAYFQAYHNSIKLQKSYLFHETDTYDLALQNVDLALASGSVLMTYDAFEIAGMIGTVLNKGNVEVNALLNNALLFEKKFRKEMNTSNVNVFQLINKARHDYSHISPQLQFARRATHTNGLEPDYFNYIFSAVDYLYNPDPSQKASSQQDLRELQSASDTAYIQAAATLTLAQNKLAPVIY
jgi:hypothetical protein